MNTRLMTNTNGGGQDDRLLELLAGEALGDLSPEESRELDERAAGMPEHDRASFEHAAAALSLMTPREEVPASLTDRLLADAREAPVAGPEAFAEPKPGASSPAQAPSTGSSPTFLALSGWLAAAAALVAAFVIAVGQPDPPQALTAEVAYERFLDEAPDDLVTHQWTPVHASDVSGEIVWSDKAQEGYMVLEGLAANDPTQRQYQLWIFDAQRPSETPVDGGVFDIPDAGRRTVVPITPKILVRSGQWFAVTVEPPGGVVVSDREEIPVVANMPSS